MKKKKWAIFGILGAAAVVGALFAPVLSTGQEPDLRETVSVSSNATVEVPPEIANVFLSVEVDAPSASAAADELAASMNDVIDAMEGIGFTEDDITIRSVRVFAERDRDRNITGYSGRASIGVKTDDLDRIGEIIDVGTDAGADGVDNINFDLKDNSEAIKEALRRAMRFAIVKADVLAIEAGRTRGRALVIDEGNTTDPRPQVFERALAGVIAGGGRGGGGGPEPIPIIPPDITIRARIFVTFALQ